MGHGVLDCLSIRNEYEVPYVVRKPSPSLGLPTSDDANGEELRRARRASHPPPPPPPPPRATMESRCDNMHIAPFDALPVVPADGPWTPPPHEFEPPRASRPPRPSTATLKVRYAAVRTAEDLRQAIVFAAREDDLHGLRWLLREFPKMPRDDPTPVERAAEHGHFETLKCVLSRDRALTERFSPTPRFQHLIASPFS